MEKTEPHDWRPCPPGQLNLLARRLRKRADRRRFLTLAARSVGTLAVALGSWWLLASRQDITPARSKFRGPIYAGIACADVREAAVQFVQQEVSPKLAQQIEGHLAKCSSCRAYIDGLRQQRVS